MGKERYAEKGFRSSKSRILVAVLLAVVILLSGFSVFYFVQARDYHDAKYRAQWVLMDNILDSTSESAILLEGVAGYLNYTLEFRAILGGQLQESLNAIQRSSHAIREMYLNDRDKNETFALLEKAAAALNENSTRVAYALLDNVTEGVPYAENASLNAGLHNASAIISGLHAIFLQSFKVNPKEDASRSWERSPYSLVDRLNMQSVRSSCTDIMSLF